MIDRLRELTEKDWEHVAFGVGVLLGASFTACAMHITFIKR